MKNRKKAALLGCASVYLPVIFDACYEALDIKEFHIYKNIPVDSSPEMNVNTPAYTIQIFEPGEPIIKDYKLIFFGVNGPYAKRKVYEYFNEKYRIKKSDYGTVNHPRSIIAPTTLQQKAAFIEPGTVISSQTSLGFGVTIKRSASIGHHCIVEDYVEINPGVSVSGHVKLETGVIIGSGAVIRNGITIGKNSIIGMGSVVTKNIPSGVVAFGNPCEVIRENILRE